MADEQQTDTKQIKLPRGPITRILSHRAGRVGRHVEGGGEAHGCLDLADGTFVGHVLFEALRVD